MNNKGQALVEFILIIPVFLLILFAIIDFGNIFMRKSSLETVATDVVELVKTGDSVDQILSRYDDSIGLRIDNDGTYKMITVSDKVKLTTFILNNILPNPYPLEVRRVIRSE